MKISINLTGGISLKALRPEPIDAYCSGPETENYDNTIYDTWPLDDLRNDIYSRGFEGDYDFLAWAIQSLCQSPSATALITEASSEDWEIGLMNLDTDSFNGADFHLDVPGRMILLNSGGLDCAAISRSRYLARGMLHALLRALRDIWHERRNGGFNEKFTPESVLMLERIRAADCACYAILCAWELRTADQPDVWRHILASNESDIAMAFSNVLERSGTCRPHTRALHEALIAAFRQWHRAHERTNCIDHETLEYMDELLRACLGDGAFGAAKVTAMDVMALSCLPDRTAYLQTEATRILIDPGYAGLADDVNLAHFSQILHDSQSVRVHGVAFRDAALAEKIFPEGCSVEDRIKEKGRLI